MVRVIVIVMRLDCFRAVTFRFDRVDDGGDLLKDQPVIQVRRR